MDYPALSNRVYLNFGGQGVLSRQTLETIANGFYQIEERGCFSIANGKWFSQEISQTKQAMAQELRVSADQISLTENTTVGCNIALWSIDWQQGDRLLISDGEHPGIIAISNELKRRYGVIVDVFPVMEQDQGQILHAFGDRLHRQTRMVCVSHIIWNTGQILPLKAMAELCHHNGILLAVDAAQSVGVLPLDLVDLGVDFYAFTAHKWWCAPLGTGGLYVSPAAWAQVHSTYTGWRSLESASASAKFEVATSTYPLWAGVRTALQQANQWGNQTKRYDRLTELSAQLWQGLQSIPTIHCLQKQPPSCGLVTFNVASNVTSQSPSAISEILETEHHIHIRAMPEPKCLRASVHYLNTANDLDKLLCVLADMG